MGSRRGLWLALTLASAMLVGCAASEKKSSRTADRSAADAPPAADVAEPPATVAASPDNADEEIDAQPRTVVPPGPDGSLFDGETLTGWRVLRDKAYADAGRVYVQDRTIMLETGRMQTGIAWNGDFPRDHYEVSLEAMRVAGYDFFCGMTFPVGDEPCTLIIGGWGGSVVGLSNVDYMHAAENVTTTGRSFELGRWYRIRLRVTPQRISAWIDNDLVIDLLRAGHKFSVWWEQESARPFGIGTWDTAAALRNIRLTDLTPNGTPASK